jgi:hypothetical protein
VDVPHKEFIFFTLLFYLPTELSPDSSSNQTGVLDDDYGFDIPGESGMYLDSSYQCIRFQPFQQTSWHVLCDQNLKEL